MPEIKAHGYNGKRMRGHLVTGGREDEAEAEFIPGVVDPRKLTGKRLRYYLCAEGPGHCAACGLCAYGREWSRRAKANDKAL